MNVKYIIKFARADWYMTDYVMRARFNVDFMYYGYYESEIGQVNWNWAPILFFNFCSRCIEKKM